VGGVGQQGGGERDSNPEGCNPIRRFGKSEDKELDQAGSQALNGFEAF